MQITIEYTGDQTHILPTLYKNAKPLFVLIKTFLLLLKESYCLTQLTTLSSQ